ncbi:hypothetical protein D3C71_2131830 [compost metagenome]
MGAGHGGGVVEAIADHENAAVFGFEFGDAVEFFGRHEAAATGNAELFGEFGDDLRAVTREYLDVVMG